MYHAGEMTNQMMNTRKFDFPEIKLIKSDAQV